MSIDAAKSQFDHLLDDWVAKAFAKNGNIGFAALLRLLPGCYPTDVVAALLRKIESKEGERESVWANQVVIEARQNSTTFSPQDLKWQRPTPHPLDYDWRFTPESAAVVSDMALDGVRSVGSVALLGTPSVHMLLKKKIGNHRAVLLDRYSTSENRPSSGWTGDITVDDLPELKSTVVVLDPPWYPDHICSFLWAAAFVAAEGAQVICGVPDVGTRPGVEAEWVEIVRWAQLAGLSLEVLHRGMTEYLTPPFEANALKAAGIAHVPARWRRGSVAQFRRTGHIKTNRPQLNESCHWAEESIGPVRWRLLLGDIRRPSAAPEITSILPGDILPSVSRRHPARQLARVWTSGNRVFHSENPYMLRRLLRMLQYIDDRPVDLTNIIQRAFPSNVGPKVTAYAEKALQAAMRIQQIEAREYGVQL